MEVTEQVLRANNDAEGCHGEARSCPRHRIQPTTGYSCNRYDWNRRPHYLSRLRPVKRNRVFGEGLGLDLGVAPAVDRYFGVL
ncbi:hypothetical protein ACFL2Q_09200 [Thermodesulfobacteriota bacterium]